MRDPASPRGREEVVCGDSVKRDCLQIRIAPGEFPTRRSAMNSALFEVLRKDTTATISTMLLKKGIRRCWMNGPKPLVPGGERLIGPAFTLRFVPAREDLATPESWSKPISTRSAIEAMPQGVI